MNKIKIIPIVAGIVIIVLLVFGYFRARNKSANKHISLSGNIEATEVRVSFQVAGKINKISAEEGKLVKKGEVLAQLDIDELIRIKNQAESSLEEARFNYERLKEDYARTESLFRAGSVSAQKRDAAKTNLDVAEAKMKTLDAALELARIRLSYADLSSPLDGFVLVKSAEVGEFVPTGSTIFSIADLKNVWLTGYINETDLGRVKLGQEADIKTDTYPDKIYQGKVSFISQEAEFTPKQIQTKEERTKLVYRIKISLDNSNLELKPGMPADAEIITE